MDIIIAKPLACLRKLAVTKVTSSYCTLGIKLPCLPFLAHWEMLGLHSTREEVVVSGFKQAAHSARRNLQEFAFCGGGGGRGSWFMRYWQRLGTDRRQ
jgi:hypothetical protein